MDSDKQSNTVRESLQTAGEALESCSDSARLDAELLLALATGQSRAWLYANLDESLTEKQIDVYCVLLGQRAEGRPVAQLTGVREFWSIELAVNEHTLIPRPETELLVEQALQLIPAERPRRVLDLGTGSGAIAVAIARERPDATVLATDISLEALEVAAENTETHCPGRVEFYKGSWFDALPVGTRPFHVIVANPPYVGEDEHALTDPELAFEPIQALYSGRDGLNDIRQIITNARKWLRPGGWLLLEHGFAQATKVAGLLKTAGFRSVDNVPDLAGQPRVSRGCWKTS